MQRAGQQTLSIEFHAICFAAQEAQLSTAVDCDSSVCELSPSLYATTQEARDEESNLAKRYYNS